MTTRFFQVGFSYQAQVPPPSATIVGLAVAIDVGDFDLVAPGKLSSRTIRSNRGSGRGSARRRERRFR